ncbi:hypothetical protein H4R18_004095 [Coemansia javaensis]|uniref:Uncharacterized protein n=1 Tax=Coemansia javaensis TaxID=2761396 RepID=A0A9W8LHE3_9FUNG|nr:hypothetical protein H4R18_004095 [Coemansia javaensis]
MHSGQQAGYAPLPSSTRSRRESGSPAARPGLQQAGYGLAPQRASAVAPPPPPPPPQHADYGHAPPQRAAAAAVPNAAVPSLQSWARMQYEATTQKQQQAPVPAPRSPTSSGAVFQAQQYQYVPRPHASGHGRQASAELVDPYQGAGRGQTLDVDPYPGAERGLKLDVDPYRGAARGQMLDADGAPSPVMRAVRHSRPATPPSPAAAQKRMHSQPPTPTTPTALFTALPAQWSPPVEAQARPDPASQTRMKPRSYTAADDSPRQPPAPRVASLYVPDSSPGPMPAPAPQPRLETGHAGRSQPRNTSELASAAIRGFVDMKASLGQKTRLEHQPHPLPLPPLQKQAAPAKISPETSHLIEFIERQRARSMAVDQAASPASAPPKAGSQKRSDSSERSFKRSTARLADVETAKQPGPASVDDRGLRAPWHGSPQSTHSSPGPATEPRSVAESRPIVAPNIPGLLPPSTRIVPRTRAHTTAAEPPAAAAGPAGSPLTHGGVTNRRGERLARGSNESLTPRVYARQPRPESAHSDAGRPPSSPYIRGPRIRSVGVQTEAAPKAAARSCGVQTASAIHGDDTVLDLMRQLDSLRQGHANQISEYQEQVVDLELLGQDLNAEVEQLTHKLESKEEAHRLAIEDMRRRLDDAGQRVERELGDIKAMHARRCNELTGQITLLLGRCEAYRARLVALGVSEPELLTLAAGSSPEQLVIADQAFIESQYVETRESSSEADYFRQLMDIERSMENTTMALGFELKRTQAKYLGQAADFIREQMAHLQAGVRAESRLSMRSPAAEPGATFGSPSPPPAVPPLPSSVDSQQPPPAVAPPPLPPSAQAAAAPQQPQLRHRGQRIVGPEPALEEAAALAAAVVASAPPRRQHPATMSSASAAAAVQAARRVESESRASGLSRMLESASCSDESTAADSDSTMANLLQLAASPRQSHRSPLAGIASGFFSASQDSMATAVAHPEPGASTSSTSSLAAVLGGSHPSLATPIKIGAGQPALTVSKLMQPVGAMGHHRRTDSGSVRASSMHWPPRSERRPASTVVDPHDMTAEELLESLKLPAGGALCTPTRGGTFGSLPRTPSSPRGAGSLGRHSPLPRSGSFSDLPHVLPFTSRTAASTTSDASDVTLPADLAFASYRKLQPADELPAFDPSVTVNINLGLDKTPPSSTYAHGSTRRGRRTGQRRRSRSMAAWDRR